MYAIVAVAILVTIGLALVRAGLGPTVFDRILALNMVGTKTVLLIAILAFLTEHPDFLDLALLYSLVNFVGMVAVLRISKYGRFSDPGSGVESQ